MNLFPLLLFAFIAVPVVEIYLFIEVGGAIGTWPTVGLVVLTAVIGATLLRMQGLYTLNRVQTAMARGELPTLIMLEGVVLLLCGALLLTPGFFTDALGFLGLIPPLRQAMIAKLFLRGLQAGPHGAGYASSGDEQGPRTIEGEYRREDE